MVEFIKTRNELKTYFSDLQERGYFHPDDKIMAGIKKNENRILLYIRNKTIKSNLIEIEAPTVNECLNFLKKELKWQ